MTALNVSRIPRTRCWKRIEPRKTLNTKQALNFFVCHALWQNQFLDSRRVEPLYPARVWRSHYRTIQLEPITTSEVAHRRQTIPSISPVFTIWNVVAKDVLLHCVQIFARENETKNLRYRSEIH